MNGPIFRKKNRRDGRTHAMRGGVVTRCGASLFLVMLGEAPRDEAVIVDALIRS